MIFAFVWVNIIYIVAKDEFMNCVYEFIIIIYSKWAFGQVHHNQNYGQESRSPKVYQTYTI